MQAMHRKTKMHDCFIIQFNGTRQCMLPTRAYSDHAGGMQSIRTYMHIIMLGMHAYDCIQG